MNATVDWNMKSLYGFIQHLMKRATPAPVHRPAPVDDLKAMLEAMLRHQTASRIHGVDSDELPDGHGAFGLCVSNPVPVAGLVGARHYLSSLRADEPGALAHERLGSTSCKDVTSGMIDIYRISVGGHAYRKVYLCPYYGHNSAKAPQGFSLCAGTDPLQARIASEPQ